MKNKEFGKRLKEFRTAKHMSQLEVADYCRVSLRAYSDWEVKGVVPRDEEKLEKLKELFSTDVLIDDINKDLLEEIGTECYKQGILQALMGVRLWIGNKAFSNMLESIECRNNEDVADWLMSYEAIDDIDYAIKSICNKGEL